MNEKELREEGLRGIKEFEIAWSEFFKGKPEPKNEEEDKSQQETFYHWYNYARKQSDTRKTPAEMYKEIYGKEPPQNFPINSEEPSRMMNFEWDEYYNEDGFNEEGSEGFNEVMEVANHIFENGAWQNSKDKVKEMSRRDSSKHMFRLGFFMHSQYMNEQMKTLANEMKDMPDEDVEKLINKFKKNKGEER